MNMATSPTRMQPATIPGVVQRRRFQHDAGFIRLSGMNPVAGRLGLRPTERRNEIPKLPTQR